MEEIAGYAATVQIAAQAFDHRHRATEKDVRPGRDAARGGHPGAGQVSLAVSRNGVNVQPGSPSLLRGAQLGEIDGLALRRRAVEQRLGTQVVRDVVVGIAQGQPGGDPGELEGARPTMFFAPDQIAKRGADWGPGGVDRVFGEAWGAFVSWVGPHIDVVRGEGPGALESAWGAVLAGVGPRVGHVVTFP